MPISWEQGSDGKRKMTTTGFGTTAPRPGKRAHADLKPPSRLLWLAEGRSLWEFGFAVTAAPLLLRAPRGDGHPVLVLPGFLASDASTRPLRQYLSRLGYEAHAWELGRNFGGIERMQRALHSRLDDIFEKSGRRVTVIGWSLGGIYARLLAVEAPERVRSVITLGTPFSRDPRASNVSDVYEQMTGEGPTAQEREARELLPHEFDKMRADIDVPTTSIYSKFDGIVDWHASLLRANARTENVEVIGASHVGMGLNAAVLWAIADRLALPDGSFKPFARGGPFAPAYGRPPRGS
jgi:pimeloyl-ACP methyl ester carboxylesterase